MDFNQKQQIEQSFQEALNQLNPAQIEAVQTIDGAVLVIAGPGTGKTHILSARIGLILNETDAQAHNILCLTYTDAGVLAMRKRLLQWIGPAAHKIHIHTFHSFCNAVIKENSEYFGKYEMEPLSELERIDIVRELIDKEDEKSPLKNGRWDLYYYEKHLYNLFRTMKSEAWSAEYLEERINHYINDLPLREDFYYKRNSKNNKKGDLKTKDIDTEKEKMSKLLAGVKLFPKYQKELRARGRYDYEDMIAWVNDAFQKDESLLRRFQEQYLYFLVDEFQDTNGSQMNILYQLIDYWDNPNVFVVGDDDQAIYEFQGARLKNISDFYQKYENDISTIVLTDNYRSTQHILQQAEQLINNNNERIIHHLKGLNKNLLSKTNFKKNKNKSLSFEELEINEYHNSLSENIGVIEKIESLYKAGIPYNEMAVIFAKHKQSETLIKLLEAKKIPYQTKRGIDVLDEAIIQQLMTLLRFIVGEQEQTHSQEQLLFELLHYEFMGIEASDLFALSSYQAKLNYDEKIPWRDILKDYHLLRKIKWKNTKKAKEICTLLENMNKDVVNYRCITFLERLINQSGYLNYIIQHKDKAWYLQLVHSFFDFIKRETDKNPRLSIKHLLKIIERIEQSNLQIPLIKSEVAEEGVYLTTAHGSKGLEFKAVFIIDVLKNAWEKQNNGNKYQFSFPDTVTFSTTSNIEEARRRLLYVAITRAKQYLYISYPKINEKDNENDYSGFIDELLSLNNKDKKTLIFNKKAISSPSLIEHQSLIWSETDGVQIPNQDKEIINELLENFTLSNSSLNRYLKCPLSFYYEYVLKIPSIANAAATYGTVFHYILKKAYDKMKVHPEKELPSLNFLLELFEKEMQRRRHLFTKEEYERRLIIGIDNLTGYYSQEMKKWQVNATVEKDIRNVEYRGVPIKGTIDKIIHLNDMEVELVDYKTGKHKAEKIKIATEKDKIGGTYWRQMYFYKILYENSSSHQKRVLSSKISYLSKDEKGQFPSKKIEFDLQQESLIGNMMVSTYQSIMEHDFYNGCGESTCKWCNLVNKQKSSTSYFDEDIGDLDD